MSFFVYCCTLCQCIIIIMLLCSCADTSVRHFARSYHWKCHLLKGAVIFPGAVWEKKRCMSFIIVICNHFSMYFTSSVIQKFLWLPLYLTHFFFAVFYWLLLRRIGLGEYWFHDDDCLSESYNTFVLYEGLLTWMNEWMNGWMDGRTDGRTDSWSLLCFESVLLI
jgi:hypothetical protein